MRIARVAIIFDDQLRPETTGGYCRRALEALVETVHVLPDELERLSRERFDLYVNIDDGLRYHLPGDLRPNAWWAIDTHLDFDWCLDKARDFDYVFAAQRDGAARLREAGITSATWLPLACDPEIHRPHGVVRQHDVCFIGNVFPGAREELLRLIRSHFPRTLVSERYFAAMARAYSESRLVFNRSLRNDINMRVFEALACGSMLVTNDLAENGQAELFEGGVHLATYAGAEELIDKIRYYLRHAEVRERIAAAGRGLVLEKHTYAHRMRELLGAIEKRASESNGHAKGAHGQPTPPAAIKTANNGQALAHKDPGYFEFARPELLELIPTTARRVLEIGCGAGKLGEALKSRQEVEVVGIELEPLAAQAAAKRLDRVIVGDVERLKIDFPEGHFDCLVCGDVLEHLRDPTEVLRRARRWLREGGVLVASIPNVRHHSVVTGLLEGNWTYEPAGLLDDTHLRFFTLRDIQVLLDEAEFEVEKMPIVPGPGYEEWRGAGEPSDLKLGPVQLRGLEVEEAEEFFVYQYLVRATPRRATGEQAPADAPSLADREKAPLSKLGCVLAIRDRPAAVLERSLQTYAYQSLQPADRVLLDHGSQADFAAVYRDLCRRYGWRYCRLEGADQDWHPSAAQNHAVAALEESVEVVFKSDCDILLGRDVLEAAARLARDHLVVFNYLTTQEAATYPAVITPEAMWDLFLQEPRPIPMPAWGTMAFPRRWFTEIGGYDLEFRGWGFDDADLRLRAIWSIGAIDISSAMLLHQWHPRQLTPEGQQQSERNQVYYERNKPLRQVVRNGGRLLPPPPANSPQPLNDAAQSSESGSD
jgi:SAM-dependent methyltransferase